MLFSLAPTVHALFQEIDFSLSTCCFPLVFSRFCLQRSVMHVQSCCFANQSKPEAVICFCLNLLLFCRPRCRHRRRCLTLITPTPPTKHRVKKKKRFECGQCCLHLIATTCLLPPVSEIPLYYRQQQKTKTVTHFPNYPLRNS